MFNYNPAFPNGFVTISIEEYNRLKQRDLAFPTHIHQSPHTGYVPHDIPPFETQGVNGQYYNQPFTIQHKKPFNPSSMQSQQNSLQMTTIKPLLFSKFIFSGMVDFDFINENGLRIAKKLSNETETEYILFEDKNGVEVSISKKYAIVAPNNEKCSTINFRQKDGRTLCSYDKEDKVLYSLKGVLFILSKLLNKELNIELVLEEEKYNDQLGQLLTNIRKCFNE